MKIGLLTDSTSDLSQEILEKNNIEVIPLNVHMNDQVYQDRVDLQPDDFYDKLLNVEKLPTTSQPSVGLFLEKYEDMKKNYDSIISIHISGALSGTVESAQVAARQIDGVEVEVIDSYSTSLGLGYQAILAARMIEKGKDITEIKNFLKEVRKNLAIYFTVNDLKYLEKGGRIGKAQSLVGSVLNFNPILNLDSEKGEILPFQKVRGASRTLTRMVSLCEEHFAKDQNNWVGLICGKEGERFQKFETKVKNVMEEKNIKNKVFEANVSPVLGAHVGPSVFGAILLKGDFLE